MSTVVHVILPGNAPEISSREHFMPGYEGKSLFQLCTEHNSSFADRQLIVGNLDYYACAKDYLKSIGNKSYLNIIEEDHFANVYSASFAAFSADPEEILLITPSGYLINDESAYKKAVRKMITIAEEGKIGILSFNPEDDVDNRPYSDIICSKAGVYLEELKRFSSRVFEVAQTIWVARIGNYVTVQEKMKINQVSIEEMLLTTHNKVELVIEAISEIESLQKK